VIGLVWIVAIWGLVMLTVAIVRRWRKGGE